jgi:hypothetical protein
MEIIVCGAIPPYNHLLGGKLVAMLMTSPQVINDYRRRYEGQASKIASTIAGEDVTRSANLVFLGTSSLYSSASDTKAETQPAGQRRRYSGASQYNRISIPASQFGGTGQVAYECLGVTEGQGVVHFRADTRFCLEELDRLKFNARRINSIFGEGTSPRLRKIRQGLSLLRLPDELLEHGQSRIVYGVQLAHNTKEVLTGIQREPRYIVPQQQPAKATAKIVEYWIERWLARRVSHVESIDRLANFKVDDVAVGNEI